ncbi:MAG: DUF1298 domain-containing protein [Anaerolineaceae bacterium]|nr:DUF1298 domain-containing protein [Anaerolineaceae bacterium]
MKKFPIEALDEYIRLQTISNDHQIRAVLVFDGFLDINKIKEALRKSFAMIPILGCSYQEDGKRAFWERRDFEDDNFMMFHEHPEVELNLIDYLQNIASDTGPQIFVQMIRQKDHDSLIFCLNHMAFDGSGLKSYLYLLADLYSNRQHEAHTFNQVRQLRVLLKNISLRDKISALFQKPFQGSNEAFLDDSTSNLQPRVKLFNISAEQFLIIKSICKREQITINDFILAIFAHALLQVSPTPFSSELIMQVMFDLRRYIRKHPVSSFGNFSSMGSLIIRNNKHTFLTLAAEIHHTMEWIKSGYPGIKNVLLVDAAYHLLPLKTFGQIVTGKIKAVGISTSNLGIIDDQKCSFAGSGLQNAYMLSSIKKQPAIQLSFSTFKNSITLSILGRYSAQNWQTIEQLFMNMQNEINNQCEL